MPQSFDHDEVQLATPTAPTKRFVVIALAVAVLAAGATIGIGSIVGGSGGGGGGGSPVGAITSFADSLRSGSPSNLLKGLAPAEVAGLEPLLNQLISFAGDQGFVDEGDPLAGVTIELTGLDLEPVELHRDVSKVYIRGGRISVTVDPSRLAPTVRDQIPPGLPLSVAYDVSQIDPLIADYNRYSPNPISGLFVMTVRQDGAWYISPFYTIAEYAREATGAPAADFTSSRENRAPGAANADEAVRAFVSSITDPYRLLDTLAPTEMGALLDYRASLLSALPGGLPAVSISGIQTESESLGDGRTKVFLRGAQVSGSFEGYQFSAGFSDGCGSVTVYGQTQHACLSQFVPPQFSALVNDALFLVAVEDDGGWYVSPVQTMIEYGNVLAPLMDQFYDAFIGSQESITFSETGEQLWDY